MEILIFIVVLAVAFVIGVFGFCQIIGSFQNFHIRGVGMTAFTIILWAVILIASFFAAKILFCRSIDCILHRNRRVFSYVFESRKNSVGCECHVWVVKKRKFIFWDFKGM